ncbi:hypothetical protein [Aliarcobacter cryaerophilus]|uniref:hypothetical protein n=1 Tax=Aliarcobacter cryaerophilus TaxID=28198 RepID=UPI0021B26E1E|nr:hypothetical protein [Aliarcobacter cryaerophilus]MCT7445517.1 hypothetical protein [Aliarcobacter cryaerophilus]MCT7480419.1 hypothetical protein [Aliarcobacter cryaerophilus]
MNTRDVVILVEKLIELTQKNIISWQISKNTPSLSSMEQFDTIYSTFYLNQNIRVYKYFYRYYKDEDEFYWLEDYRLETFDNFNNTLYVFPKTQNVVDLLNAVMYQNSNIEDFYKNLMGN